MNRNKSYQLAAEWTEKTKKTKPVFLQNVLEEENFWSRLKPHMEHQLLGSNSSSNTEFKKIPTI